MRWKSGAGLFGLFAAASLSLFLARAVQARDGLIEINQACVNTAGACGVDSGCFAGDTACFPVTISQPGSYILTGSLTLANTNQTAIEITAGGTAPVVIDMNGFGISGPGTCTGCPVASCTGGSGRGIYSTSSGVAVRNGVVSGMGAAGIEVVTAFSAELLNVYGNGGPGIRVAIGGGRFVDVGVNSNGGDGISLDVGYPASARNVTASCNGAEGFEAGVASVVHGINTLANAGAGISVGSGSSVTGCSILTSGSYGIECTGGGPSGYSGNVLTSNNGAGVEASGSCVQFGTNLCNGSTTCP